MPTYVYLCVCNELKLKDLHKFLKLSVIKKLIEERLGGSVD